MITNLDLYGTNDVPTIPTEVADKRISLLKERLKVLTDVHFMEQDIQLTTQVLKAIAFWTALRDGDTL